MQKNEKEEKRPLGWEMVDPKPPVIQCGHMENRVEHRENSPEMVDKTGEIGL